MFNFENNQNIEAPLEISSIDKQIQDKEAKIKKIMQNEKLSDSQKKSKVSLIQKEINTLKKQKVLMNKKG